MTGTVTMSSAKAFEAFTEHPRYKYRGCAPDVDDPTRAAGDLSLSRNAWITEDRDGAEPPKEREAREAAVVEVCLNCPVMVLCDAYASSVRPDGRLAEPRWVWGGRTALQRHRRFISQRHEATVERSREGVGLGGVGQGSASVVPAASPDAVGRGDVCTEQQRAVLAALARCTDAEAVAVAAGMDLRTANWQRSRLVTLVGLDKTRTTRAQLLAAAVEQGLLDPRLVVADDGSVPAVPPPPARPRGRRADGAGSGPGEGVDVQLSLDEVLDPSDGPASVTALFPAGVRLDAVA